MSLRVMSKNKDPGRKRTGQRYEGKRGGGLGREDPGSAAAQAPGQTLARPPPGRALTDPGDSLHTAGCCQGRSLLLPAWPAVVCMTTQGLWLGSPQGPAMTGLGPGGQA